MCTKLAIWSNEGGILEKAVKKGEEYKIIFPSILFCVQTILRIEISRRNFHTFWRSLDDLNDLH